MLQEQVHSTSRPLEFFQYKCRNATSTWMSTCIDALFIDVPSNVSAFMHRLLFLQIGLRGSTRCLGCTDQRCPNTCRSRIRSLPVSTPLRDSTRCLGCTDQRCPNTKSCRSRIQSLSVSTPLLGSIRCLGCADQRCPNTCRSRIQSFLRQK